MAAALARRRTSAQRDEGPLATNLARDLYQIAELIEMCFADRLDASGRSAVDEMKAVAKLEPLLWLLALIDPSGLGLGRGYVWRVNQRVVGNVSLYQGGAHPRLGRGWLIANVAVHPDYRRRGIARTLMEATLSLANQLRGRWVSLQVEADNEPAIALYHSLNFEQFETLDQWQVGRVAYEALPSPSDRIWSVRLRRVGEAEAEAALIYDRARRGAMAWTRTIERCDITEGMLGDLFGGVTKQHWVLPAPSHPLRLNGVLWAESSGWRHTRLTLFLDPALQDPADRQALLLHALRLADLQGRAVRVETVAGDPPVEDLLRVAGFQKTRSLVLMRRLCGS